jgi:hypothetical protein
LERSLEGRDQLLKLVKRQAREIQELHRAGLQLGEPYTSHGSCLLSLSRDIRGASYQKESGINSILITPEAVIRAYVVSSRDELKPGAHIAIVRALKKPDGTYEADRVNVGRDGLVP